MKSDSKFASKNSCRRIKSRSSKHAIASVKSMVVCAALVSSLTDITLAQAAVPTWTSNSWEAGRLDYTHGGSEVAAFVNAKENLQLQVVLCSQNQPSAYRMSVLLPHDHKASGIIPVKLEVDGTTTHVYAEILGNSMEFQVGTSFLITLPDSPTFTMTFKAEDAKYLHIPKEVSFPMDRANIVLSEVAKSCAILEEQQNFTISRPLISGILWPRNGFNNTNLPEASNDNERPTLEEQAKKNGLSVTKQNDKDRRWTDPNWAPEIVPTAPASNPRYVDVDSLCLRYPDASDRRKSHHANGSHNGLSASAQLAAKASATLNSDARSSSMIAAVSSDTKATRSSGHHEHHLSSHIADDLNDHAVPSSLTNTAAVSSVVGKTGQASTAQSSSTDVAARSNSSSKTNSSATANARSSEPVIANRSTVAMVMGDAAIDMSLDAEVRNMASVSSKVDDNGTDDADAANARERAQGAQRSEGSGTKDSSTKQSIGTKRNDHVANVVNGLVSTIHPHDDMPSFVLSDKCKAALDRVYEEQGKDALSFLPDLFKDPTGSYQRYLLLWNTVLSDTARMDFKNPDSTLDEYDYYLTLFSLFSDTRITQYPQSYYDILRLRDDPSTFLYAMDNRYELETVKYSSVLNRRLTGFVSPRRNAKEALRSWNQFYQELSMALPPIAKAQALRPVLYRQMLMRFWRLAGYPESLHLRPEYSFVQGSKGRTITREPLEQKCSTFEGSEGDEFFYASDDCIRGIQSDLRALGYVNEDYQAVLRSWEAFSKAWTSSIFFNVDEQYTTSEHIRSGIGITLLSMFKTYGFGDYFLLRKCISSRDSDICAYEADKYYDSYLSDFKKTVAAVSDVSSEDARALKRLNDLWEEYYENLTTYTNNIVKKGRMPAWRAQFVRGVAATSQAESVLNTLYYRRSQVEVDEISDYYEDDFTESSSSSAYPSSSNSSSNSSSSAASSSDALSALDL